MLRRKDLSCSQHPVWVCGVCAGSIPISAKLHYFANSVLSVAVSCWPLTANSGGPAHWEGLRSGQNLLGPPHQFPVWPGFRLVQIDLHCLVPMPMSFCFRLNPACVRFSCLDVSIVETAFASQINHATALPFEGGLEVKLPTIWTDGKAEVGRAREEERRSEKRKSQKKEDAGARKGRKLAIHYVFPMICGSGGSKSWLAKAAGAEPSGQMRDEKLHAVVARSTFCNHSKKHSSPFVPSADSLCHPCITTTHLSYSVLSLKLPPPPCAALLAINVKVRTSLPSCKVLQTSKTKKYYARLCMRH